MDVPELPVSTVRRIPVSSLHTVRDLEDALHRNGLTKDDRIDRRDQVLLFRRIEREMLAEISRAAKAGEYDGATDCEKRLSQLRKEFDWLLTQPEARSRTLQQETFGGASAKMHERLLDDRFVAEETLNARISHLRQDQLKSFEIERENLELQLSRLVKPPMAYSKRLADLIRAEAGLIRLAQFEDARNVRRMIEKIEPKERKVHDNNWQALLDRKRRDLAKKHEDDQQRLDERIKSMQMTCVREQDLQDSIFGQRLRNHAKDMTHTHLVEARRLPEMTVVPSAAQTKRPGYNMSSSSRRGQQMLDNVRGKQEGDEVFVSSLVDIHAFTDHDRPPGPSSPRATLMPKASDLLNTFTLPQHAHGFAKKAPSSGTMSRTGGSLTMGSSTLALSPGVTGEGGVMLAPTLRPHRL